MDRRFTIWERPFKFTGEAYYKQMDEPDPLRIGQRADPLLRGQPGQRLRHGLDLKLNGEFIEGIESWVGASVMSIQEDLYNDSYTKRYNAAGRTDRAGFTFDQVAVDSTVVSPVGSRARPTSA
jgi:hypothetical protein